MHAKFVYKEKGDLDIKVVEKADWRKTAIIHLEGLASTNVKDGSRDIIEQDGIDLSRFEAGNAPLKSMHGRTVLSNIGVVKSLKIVDREMAAKEMPHLTTKLASNFVGLYIKAEARLNISTDNNGRAMNQEDYDLYDRLENRTLNGFSVGFHNIVQEWDSEKGANIIKTMTLHEVSVVDVPDNPLTIVKFLEELHKEQELLSDLDGMKRPAHVTSDYLAALMAKQSEGKALSYDEQKELEIWGKDVDEEETDENEDTDEEETEEEGEKELWAEETEDEEESEEETEETTEEVVTEEISEQKKLSAIDLKGMVVEKKAIGKEELQVGSMYRYKRTFMSEYGNSSYVFNAECIKVDYSDEKASESDPMVYFLDYSLDIDGFKPWTSVEKTLFSNFEIVELSEEQMKELKISQESKSLWKGWSDADEGVNKDLEIQAKDKQIGEMTKALEDAKLALETEQKAHAETEGLLTEAQSIAGELLESNKSLLATVAALETTIQKKVQQLKALKQVKVEHGAKLVSESNEEVEKPAGTKNVADIIGVWMKSAKWND